MPCFAGEGHEAFALILAVRVGAAESKKAEVQIAAPEQLTHTVLTERSEWFSTDTTRSSVAK